ncbi:NADH:flavin oxidoreductase/NADH oxidase [Aeromicrobium fastidiosum]|uniref:NADH:flavin oxidoreductase/NADH oxidase n=1 Tax=Aeromicrobium fastidiosum TaxID=52699 RepID=UPI002023412E|nr:NADH:flavin oxidoreductase/NADH oxidase [Aeromicrobium fastidiosum]MCL8252495.1 NADH:flavin oxidoreductase/NADH oxidase [Aeromicrobium fastidiosum]
MSATSLFSSVAVGGVDVRNRVWVAPMCQYSCLARDGHPTAWHRVHYGAFATGGFGLVVTEATSVVPEGRISPEDAGIWSDEHVDSWRPVVEFAHEHDTRIVMQLAHAGRKASTHSDLSGRTGTVEAAEGGWETVGPSVGSFGSLAPCRALGVDEVRAMPSLFAEGARRAVLAGFDGVEIHAAHGYLLHEFLSPLINHRDDEYGGDLEGRSRLLREVLAAVRAVLPAGAALLLRISATDWADGGWDPDQSVELVQMLADAGVDLVDVSSGGAVEHQEIPVGPRYQVGLAGRIRRATDIPTGAVGLITDPRDAQDILDEGESDVVLLGRAALREPRWPLRASRELDVDGSALFPAQYRRAVLRPGR